MSETWSDVASDGRGWRESYSLRWQGLSEIRSVPGVAVVASGGRPEVEIGMPPAFAAFCLSHLEIYNRYVALRVGDEAKARMLVGAVFGDLAMNWAEALESPSPSALAWRLLAARTNRVAVSRCLELYRVLSSSQADAVLLRYRLGLPEAKAADVMGRQPEDFGCLLRSAVRSFAA